MGVEQAINPHVVDPDGEAVPKLRIIWYDRHNHAMPCILATWGPGIFTVWANVTAEQLRTLAPMALLSSPLTAQSKRRVQWCQGTGKSILKLPRAVSVRLDVAVGISNQ